MKPLPKKKRLLLQKKLREQVSKLREMVSSLMSPEMSTGTPEAAKVRLSKKVAPERDRKWRRKL